MRQGPGRLTSPSGQNPSATTAAGAEAAPRAELGRCIGTTCEELAVPGALVSAIGMSPKDSSARAPAKRPMRSCEAPLPGGRDCAVEEKAENADPTVAITEEHHATRRGWPVSKQKADARVRRRSCPGVCPASSATEAGPFHVRGSPSRRHGSRQFVRGHELNQRLLRVEHP